MDAVIETPDGRIIGVEVKAGATIRSENLAGLRSLASHTGERFVAGYVLYTGQQHCLSATGFAPSHWTPCGCSLHDSGICFCSWEIGPRVDS